MLAISKNGRLAAGSLTVEASASGTFDIAAARLRVVQSGRFEPRCSDTEDTPTISPRGKGVLVSPIVPPGGNRERHRKSTQV